ncbi:cbb3-type cytochrome c oxidase subunit III [Photobacterium lutimaris]|nr:cbb3-type cytochrome c oxidase subunit III [Photobacterium lutimaris]
MKVTCRIPCMQPIINVFATLALLTSYIAPASAQSQPVCCNDRWDPKWTQREMWGPSMMNNKQRQRMTRHWTFMHSSIPQEYLSVKNPFTQNPDAVREGGKLYQQKCSTCHGAQGLGDGDIANSLNPSPALLAYMIQMPMAIDEYLLWSISDGGQAFGTDMPAYKDQLSRESMWKIITFMRAGFPSEAQRNNK